MRNKKIVFVLAAATIFGLIAAFGVTRYLANAQSSGRNLNNIVVAKVNIPVGTRIIPEQVTTAQFPPSAVPEGIFNAPEDVIGRVAVTNILAREPVTTSRLAPEGSLGGLSAVIAEGYRAMTVKVDDVVGVSGFLVPGTLVDIVVTIDPPNKTNNQDPVSKIVLQNIKVLASGQNMEQPTENPKPDTVRAVTLQVTPEQAEKLALASTQGKLQLVLRNAADQADEQTRGADTRSLLTGEQATIVPPAGANNRNQQQPTTTAPPATTAPRRPAPRPMMPAAPPAAQKPTAPAPPPRRGPSVEVINGSKRSNVEFP
ncbi:MAG: Flp pilus assembly protein CpaB [Acidobacteriota bacterium]|nr:Flp pilus assembly protein CpaB [Acidobacteriota bacterium]